MKLTINTTQLQAMLNKAVRGAGNNKLITKTSLIAISLKNGKLTLMTNDDANYLYITADGINGDDLYVVVDVELFAKLIAKMTSEETTLEVVDSRLVVKGNGKYDIEISLDDDGTPVVLPDPTMDFKKDNVAGKVNSVTVTNIISSIKSALLTTAEYPWYMGYYVAEDVLATDTYTVGSYAKGFLTKPSLISSEAMDLVGLLSDDITIYEAQGKMLFEADNGSVYAPVPPNIDKYKVDDIRALVKQDFEYSCKVAKTPILNLLDRISLFVGTYDNGEITLSFTADGLNVTSKYANETIQYAEDGTVGNFTCKTDINTLTTQIKSQLSNVIEIQYGKENAIKLIDNDVTSVVALLGD